MARLHVGMTDLADPLQALFEVIDVLEELGLSYAVGGSVASSVFGEPRASADADVLVELAEEDVPGLLAALDDDYYVPEDAAREAVRVGSSFNIVHLSTTYKIDLFVAGSQPLDQEQLARRVRVVIAQAPERFAWLTAPENIVLRKLDWYRQGGGVSDRQWRDVLGVLKVQADRLDLGYLRASARSARLTELLERALREAGLEGS